MDCKQMKKHLFSAIAFVCMITVADNHALEPSKNEFKIVSPVPSGSTVEMITQAPRLDTLRGKTMSDFVAKSIGTDDGMLPYREALVNAGGLESTSNVQRFLAQYRPVIHQ